MKPDAARIAALERALGIGQPEEKTVGELAGYVALMDSQDREASDRVQVTFTIGAPRREGGDLRLDLKINGGPITLIPTRFGSVRAVAVFEDGSKMPACFPDVAQQVEPGWTFTVVQ